MKKTASLYLSTDFPYVWHELQKFVPLSLSIFSSSAMAAAIGTSGEKSKGEFDTRGFAACSLYFEGHRNLQMFYMI